jgi:hypothetical protein
LDLCLISKKCSRPSRSRVNNGTISTRNARGKTTVRPLSTINKWCMSPNLALSTAASPVLGPPTAHTAARLIFPTVSPMYKRPDRSVATVAAIAVAAPEHHRRDNDNRTILHNHDHHVTGSTICTTTTTKSDQWRRYGRARRQWLVDNDAQTFRINKAVDVEQYYRLGHRVRRSLL